MTLAIEASGLVKAFGETRAVAGVDLAVRPGAVYGFLGPNGAGKTTTMRMLATLLEPDGRDGAGVRPRRRPRRRRGP
jgi:ABC-2 type transport system ATP-binding protein